MSVREILEANARFRDKYQRVKVPDANGWAIVTCCDRRLSGLLEASMGFRPGEAHVIRTAGNTVSTYDNSIIRSISILVMYQNIRKIAVVGHTNCAAQTDTYELTGMLEKAGIGRQLAGSDPREFFGLIENQNSAVRDTIDRISKSGFVPPGIELHGFVIETSTGKLKHIYSHTVEKIDIPDLIDSEKFGKHEERNVQKITTVDSVRGQEKVRQFSGKIDVPTKVRSSVESVKVPVNIRTPVRKVDVPTRIKTHEGQIKIPKEVKMPERLVNLDKVGVDFERILEKKKAQRESSSREIREPHERSRSKPESRGQSQGSWQVPRKQSAESKTGAPKERKYCPKCGSEYYPHVERCTDCRVRLVSREQYVRERQRRIKPVLNQRESGRSRRDDRGRSIGNFRKRR